MKKVILIDDEIEIQVLIADFLRNHGVHVDAFADVAEAGEKLNDEKYDLIITDLRMPEEDGVSVIYKAKNVWLKNTQTPIIVVTGAAKHENGQMVLESLEKLGIKVIQKPFSPEDILEAACTAFGIDISEIHTLLE